MSNINYTVYWADGSHRDFQASSALIAYVRALSYSLVTKLNKDIEYVLDDANGKIYHNWDWDFSYSEADKTFVPSSIKRYTEDDVEEMFEAYIRYVGGDKQHMLDWFHRNKK